MNIRQYPTQEEIKKYLSYDPETGVFIWKEKQQSYWPEGKYQKMNCMAWNAKYAGKVVGTKTDAGYINIQMKMRNLRAHRLAWIYMNGDNSFTEIDHINRIKDDNRICNLRVVDRRRNTHNYLLAENNHSGVRGVSWNKQFFRWEVKIKINSESVHLGIYKDFDDAVKARYEAEVKYGFIDSLPDSTAKQYLQEAAQ
jgi:hypothetical protein